MTTISALLTGSSSSSSSPTGSSPAAATTPVAYPMLASLMRIDAEMNGNTMLSAADPANPGILLDASFNATNAAPEQDFDEALSSIPTIFDPRTVAQTLPWWGHLTAQDIQSTVSLFRDVVNTAIRSDATAANEIPTPMPNEQFAFQQPHIDYLTPPVNGSTPVELLDVVDYELLNCQQQCYPQSLPPALVSTGPWRVSSHTTSPFTTTPAAGTNTSTRRHICQWIGCTHAILEFPTAQALTDHVAELHIPRRQPVYHCGWIGCKRSTHAFRHRDKMLVHVRLHTDMARYRCTIDDCNREFSRVDSFEDHQKVHAAQGRNCHCRFPGCTRSYFHAKSLRKHERMAHGINYDAQQRQQQQP